MENNEIMVLSGKEVSSLLANQETELIRIVQRAYEAHAGGDSSLPYSSFLRFPKEPRNRIIALPAYLGAGFEVAGIKWIASFPGNLEHGLNRASAVIVLNSIKTGHPEAILEGSIVNAKRTAASAALAASVLLRGDTPSCVGIIGCGLINFEIVRFLLVTYPEIRALVLFDLQKERAQQFRDKLLGLSDKVEISLAQDIAAIFRSSPLVSLATTAAIPHIFDLSECLAGSILLHISLRDLSPEVILTCENIVDDIDHVCREQTSIHLAEQRVGNRNFIRCALGDILRGTAFLREDTDSPIVFSPFGLGVLDIAVSKFVYDLARSKKIGTIIPSFL